MSGAPIILPLTAKILRGVVCDGGNYNNPCGFDANAGKIYASNTAVAFIVLCRYSGEVTAMDGWLFRWLSLSFVSL